MSGSLVTDPDVLAELNGGGAGPKPVSDPNLLRELNGGSADLSSMVPDTQLAMSQRARPGPGAYLAPQPIRDAFDEMGDKLPLDSSKFVIARNPDSGKLDVYHRTPDLEAASGPLGQGALGLGRMVGMGMTGGVVPGATAAGGAARIGEAAQALDIPLTPGIAFPNPAVRTAESVVSRLPLSAGTVAARQDASLKGTADAVERTAAGLGDATTPADIGATVRAGAERFVNQEGPALSGSEARAAPTRDVGFNRKSAALYDRADQFIPASTGVDMGNAQTALQRFSARFQNPELSAQFQNSSLGKWADILERAGGKLSWGDATQFRSEVGSMLKKGELVSGVDQGQLKQLYGALTSDLRETAGVTDLVNPGALKAFDQATAYYKAGIERVNDALGKLLTKSDEGIYTALMSKGGEKGATASAEDVRAIMRSLPTADREEVASGILRNLGKTSQTDSGFSINTFLTNYGKLSDAAKGELFQGAPLQKALENLETVMKGQRGLDRARNTSNSGSNLVMGGLGAAFISDPISTVASLVGAGAMTRLLMNPAVVNWMAGSTNPVRAGAAAARAEQLTSIAKFYPEASSDIRRLQDAYARAGALGDEGQSK